MKPNLLGRARYLLVILAVVAGAPAAGAAPLPPPVLVRIAPPPGAIGFGAAVAGLGDLDGDGFGDIAVAAPGSDHVYVISGATFAVLYDIAGPIPGLEFGAAVAAVGDVDRDGVPDLAVGAPPDPTIVAPPCASGRGCVDPAPAAGQAFVISGASGAVVRQWAETTASLAFGRSMSGAGDLSGDGVPDVVVGAPGLAHGRDTVFAYSGADGAQLWSVAGPSVPPGSGTRFGELVALTPDQSGDRVADLLVSTTAVTHGGPAAVPISGVPVPTPVRAGRVDVVSGADGGLVRSISDPVPADGDAFGGAAAAVGDQDGDGVVDHLVGERGTRQLHLYSGRDRTLIRSMAAPANPGGQGVLALAHVGDRDGDGRDDVWVGIGAARAVFLVNATGAVLAAAAGPSAQGSFGHALSAVENPGGGSGAGLVVGDPTEPGGGAAYLVQAGSSPPPVVAAAGQGGDLVRRQTGTSTTTSTSTTIPTATEPTTTTPAATGRTATETPAPITTATPTTTALPAKVISATATLPKPAGVTSGGLTSGALTSGGLTSGALTSGGLTTGGVTTARGALPTTGGGADWSQVGLFALGLGLVVTVLGRDRGRANGAGARRGSGHE